MMENRKDLEGLLQEMNLLRKKILVIENNEESIKAASLCFAKENVYADYAANAQEALEKIKNNGYHGIILNWHPENNDWQAAASAAEEKGIPYIFYASYHGKYVVNIIYLDAICARMGLGERVNTRYTWTGWQSAFDALKKIIENPGQWHEQYDILDTYALKREEIREALEKKEAKIRARQNGERDV